MASPYKVPIFRLAYPQSYVNEYFTMCQQIFDEGFLTNHHFVQKFERTFAQWTGAKYCVATSNGTSALEIILKAIDVKGRKVLLPANTFMACVRAIQNAGGTPELVDIDSESGQMDLHELAEKLRPDIGAVMLVHIGGIISKDLFKIVEMSKKHGVPLIEDGSQSIGSRVGGDHCGTFGLAGSFSFFTTKVMTTGEGGAVVTNDEDFYGRLVAARQFGKSKSDATVFDQQGTNAKISEFQAALGLLELDRIDQRVELRKKWAQLYQSQLQGTEFRPVIPVEGMTSSLDKQMILSPYSYKDVQQHLENHSIQMTGGVYHRPLNEQPEYSRLCGGSYPAATKFGQYHFCPPCYPELTEEEVIYVCDVLKTMKDRTSTEGRV